jgi:mono/diheme cytochrome c family protein
VTPWIRRSIRLIALVLSLPAVAQQTPLAQGRYLVAAGNCAGCHTAPDGRNFAGGVALETPFGIIYASNITPEPETGIGRWSFDDFIRAMRQGIAADGTRLYPAFPYPSFTQISDGDLKLIWNFLRSEPPVHTVPRANALSFPFNLRVLMAAWNALYLKLGPYVPDPAKPAQWNRGAYLVQGLEHCGACHTPHNALGAEMSRQALTGGVYRDRVSANVTRNWSTPNITGARSGLASWTVDDLAHYLKAGHSARAGSFGPMNGVITNSTAQLEDEDIRAIAVYLKDLAPGGAAAGSADAAAVSAGQTVYTLRCATCHLPDGRGDASTGPPLAGSAIVQAPDPAALINVTLYGAEILLPEPPDAWKSMQGFAADLTDEDVAALATYLRASWGNSGNAVASEQVARQR